MNDKEEKVVKYISNNQNSIIANIAYESVAVYQYLKTEFEKTDVSENHCFQFVFRSFYGLDSAGLKDDFKKKYFELLQQNKGNPSPDFRSIIKQLYEIKNIKEKESLQISFTSKLIHTLQNDYPIYDSKVANLMKFRYLSNEKNADKNVFPTKRMEGYLEQIHELKQLYGCIKKQIGENLFIEFDNRFKVDISHEKKIDFILWSAGKLKEKEDKML
jgi:hypothetical protein